MRVAFFYPNSLYAAWSLGEGLIRTLKRMGVEVLEVPLPPTPQVITQAVYDLVRQTAPTIEQLNECNLILLSGPEHIAGDWGVEQGGGWIRLIYGSEWNTLKVPKAAWYHESRERTDNRNFDFSHQLWVADHHFFPAIQDAEFYDQEQFAIGRSHWLPFGADTDIFYPCWSNCGPNLDICAHKPVHKYGTSFIGLVYGYRQKYLQALSQYQHPPLTIGNVTIQDLGGVKGLETAKLYAENLRQIKLFFNLPALSTLVTSKVVEIMACGTFLLTHRIAMPGGRNLKPFVDGQHLIYYTPNNLAQTAALLSKWSKDDMSLEREQIALEGCREVHRNHRLDQRLTDIFTNIGIPLNAEAQVTG